MAVSGRLGTFAIGLKRRRSILGMFSENRRRTVEAQDPERCRIDFQKLFLVLDHDALTGSLEQRAEFMFALLQRLLCTFPVDGQRGLGRYEREDAFLLLAVSPAVFVILHGHDADGFALDGQGHAQPGRRRFADS